MAKQAYVCEHCREFFASMEAAEMHEKICAKNPANKVNDKVLFRLSMIYEELDDIVACAISEVAGNGFGCMNMSRSSAD